MILEILNDYVIRDNVPVFIFYYLNDLS